MQYAPAFMSKDASLWSHCVFDSVTVREYLLFVQFILAKVLDTDAWTIVNDQRKS